MWATDRTRPPLFRRLLSQHPAPLTPEDPSVLLSRFFTPSMAFAVAGAARLPLVPVAGLTFRRCRIHFMLRAVVLRPFLRGILRFSTTGHPEALGACYVASWQLPRLDSHQLADDSFRTHPTDVRRRHRYFNNASTVRPMSLAICRSRMGEMSLPGWNGTVVHRPSGCRYCLCEPRCRTSIKPSRSRIAATSRGFSTGGFLMLTQSSPSVCR